MNLARTRTYTAIICMCLFLLLAYPFGAAAQSPYLFTHFSRNDFLNTNLVNDVITDRQGFVWLATGQGLQRYDGKRWLNFMHQPGQSGCLPDDAVLDLLEDSQDRFWVATSAGVSLFHRNSHRFEPVPIKGFELNTALPYLWVYETGDGHVWASFRQAGLYRYEDSSRMFIPYQEIMPAYSAYIGHMAYDSINRGYWMQTDSGLALFDLRKRVYYNHRYNPQKLKALESPAANMFTIALYLNKQGQLWFSTWSRHGCYDIKKNENVFLDTTGVRNVRSYITDKTGTTWGIGYDLVRMTPGATEMEVIEKKPQTVLGIDFQEAQNLWEDQESNIWLATDRGVYLFNPVYQQFHPKKLKDAQGRTVDKPNINGFVQLRDGRTLVLTWGVPTLFTFDRQLRPIKDPFQVPVHVSDQSGRMAWAALQDSRGLVWVGCQIGRLLQLDPVTHRVRYIEDSIFRRVTIRSIAEDRFGNIWMGTQHSGLVKWERSTSRFKRVLPFSDRFQGNGSLIGLALDKQDILWVSSRLGGLLKVDIRKDSLLQQYRHVPGDSTSLPSSVLKDLEILNRTELLLASDKGLIIFNTETGRSRLIGTKEGLSSRNIITLQKDSEGLVWFSHDNGLSRYDHSNGKLVHFGIREGLPDEIYFEGSSGLLSDGTVLFGGEGGFVHFRPNQVRDMTAAPPVTITGFRVFDQYWNVDSLFNLNQRIELKHHQNFITIEFASLSQLLNRVLEYEYQLVGINKDWVTADMSQLAHYTHLPAGKYEFRVRVKARSGMPEQPITTFILYIKPPFWQRWWFYMLMALSLVGAVMGLIYIRQKRKEETERVRSRIARDLHDDMGSTLSTINILSEMARLQLDGDREKTRELMNRISDNSTRIMESMDDIVWSIDPTHDSMEEILSRMREFAGHLLEARGIDYEFQEDPSVQRLSLDLEKRHDFFMIFKEAVNNLAKYSGSRRAYISVGLQASKLELKVEDEGGGFDESLVSDGNGLINMRRRAENLGGTLEVRTAPGLGTRVRLLMPV